LQCHAPPHGSTLFAGIKDPWRRKRGFWLLGLYFGLFGLLLLGALLWAFWCGKPLEGKRIIEGKMLKGKIAEGKMLKRG
jgi:hypothetical protein